ncbi:MAG TPA: RidA family protein [Acidimicrobiales bacterium]|nr:RidA family protein [Acidimicrobiales bacterium]
MSAPVGPYSPWRRAGDWVILSGQIGLVAGAPAATLIEGGAAAQLRQALTNATALLEEAGTSLEAVVKSTLYLVDMSDFAACNEVWMETFSPPRPTRSAVAVAQLPLGALTEAELWAYAPSAKSLPTPNL